MILINSKKKIYIILAIWGIVFLALIIFIIYPLLKSIQEESKELVLARKGLNSLEERFEEFNQFKETYGSPALESINKLFVDPKVPIEFIESLEEIAKTSEGLIDISVVSPKVAKTDPWPALGFQIMIVSSPSNFLKFLEKIETSPYLIEIQNLNVKNLTEAEIRSTKYEGFTLSDIKGALTIKVYAK